MFGDWEKVDSLPDVSGYGKYRYLLQGYIYDEGNDEWNGEIILTEHKIIAQIVD
jgi:hypothetical protein